MTNHCPARLRPPRLALETMRTQHLFRDDATHPPYTHASVIHFREWHKNSSPIRNGKIDTESSSQAYGLGSDVCIPKPSYQSPKPAHFGCVNTVSYGSSTIFRAPAGAASRNGVPSPSANTLPKNTSCFPVTDAYTGTDVTRFSGASFCRIIPLTTIPECCGVIFTDFSSSFGNEVPLIHPSRNQSSDFLPSYRNDAGRSSANTSSSCRVVTGLPSYLSRTFLRPRMNGLSGVPFWTFCLSF